MLVGLTRGRFIVDEVENLRKREIRFDMNRLARVAADSVGSVNLKNSSLEFQSCTD
jgi:hypothetical protein